MACARADDGSGGTDPEQIFTGVAASPGLAIGPLRVEAPSTRASERDRGTPEEELVTLDRALGSAAEELSELAQAADPDGAEILEFQIALLDDDDLLEPVRAAIEAGSAAGLAWREALEAEIAAYRTSGDELLEARTADLADLRERVLLHLSGRAPAERTVLPDGAIILAADLTPSQFLALDLKRIGGLAFRGGSRAGHVALLARARALPLVTGLGEAASPIADGVPAILDGEAGTLVIRPSSRSRAGAEARIEAQMQARRDAESHLRRPAMTADGERIQVLINVDDPAFLEGLDPGTCDGIGLVRSEFLFEGEGLPDEETQFLAYRRILAWAEGRPVTIRTLDAGADKPLPGLTAERETNPFLGLRGIRLSLHHPEVLRVQLRALARAADHGPLKVMVPMVTVPAELEAVRTLFQAEVEALRAQQIAAALPPLGMMVEVPAAALSAERFDAAFFSIGSNDLVQYLLAVARDTPAVADLYDVGHPAVLEVIAAVVRKGLARRVEVSLCGEMAGMPEVIPALLGAGLRQLSVAPGRLAEVKAAIAGLRLHG